MGVEIDADAKKMGYLNRMRSRLEEKESNLVSAASQSAGGFVLEQQRARQHATTRRDYSRQENLAAEAGEEWENESVWSACVRVCGSLFFVILGAG